MTFPLALTSVVTTTAFLAGYPLALWQIGVMFGCAYLQEKLLP